MEHVWSGPLLPLPCPASHNVSYTTSVPCPLSLYPALCLSYPFIDLSLCEVMEGVGMVTVEEVKWCGGGCVSGDSPTVGAWLVTLSKLLLIPMECCVQWATVHSRHSPSPLAPPPVPLASMCDAVKLCIQRLSQQLSAAGASIEDISHLQFFLPRYSSGSPLSSEGISLIPSSCSPPSPS